MKHDNLCNMHANIHVYFMNECCNELVDSTSKQCPPKSDSTIITPDNRLAQDSKMTKIAVEQFEDACVGITHYASISKIIANHFNNTS